MPRHGAADRARAPQATPREFARYVAAVAEAGLRDETPTSPPARTSGVQVLSMHAAKGVEFDVVYVLGLSAARMPGRPPADVGDWWKRNITSRPPS